MRKSLKNYAASAAVALSLSTPLSADVFLELEGEIKGDSVTVGYEVQINVLSWAWGLSNSGSFHTGGGGGSGKANFQDISISKLLDQASPVLYLYGATGDFFNKGTLSVTANIGGKPTTITELTMNKVLVTSASLSSSGDEQASENITLNFESFILKNWTIKSDGSLDTPKEFKWDISTNQPL